MTRQTKQNTLNKKYREYMTLFISGEKRMIDDSNVLLIERSNLLLSKLYLFHSEKIYNYNNIKLNGTKMNFMKA